MSKIRNRRVAEVLGALLFLAALVVIFLDRNQPASGSRTTPAAPIQVADTRESDPRPSLAVRGPPQDAIPPQPGVGRAATRPTRTLRGLVVARDTGRPIIGALVAPAPTEGDVVLRESTFATTDDGKFTLMGVDAEACVFVQSNGYLPYWESIAALGENARIVLERGATITGRVVSPEGKGVEGVAVLALAPGGRAVWPFDPERVAVHSGSPGSRTSTGPNGDFTLHGLEDGREYRIDARRHMWRVHEDLGPVRIVQATAPADGLELVITPLAAVEVDAVDDGTGSPITADVSARGGPARGFLNSHVSVEDSRLSGYRVTDLASSTTYACYYVPSPDTVVDGQPRNVVTISCTSIGYESKSIDVNLEWGETKHVVLRMKRVPRTKWVDVSFSALLPNGTPYDGSLVLRLRRERDHQPTANFPLRFVEGRSTPIRLPEGSYNASPGGLGASCRWWSMAGPAFSFEIDGAAGVSQEETLSLVGTPVVLDIRAASGSPVLDVSVGVRGEQAREPWWDYEWDLSLLDEGLWAPGQPRTLWLPKGRFEIVVGQGTVELGRVGVEADGSGTPVSVQLKTGG